MYLTYLKGKASFNIQYKEQVNIQGEKRMERKLIKLIGPLGLLALCGLFVAACSKNEDMSAKEIKSVMEMTLTLPDKELITQIDDPANAPKIDVEGKKSKGKNELEKVMEKRYGDKFTDKGYEEFTKGIGSDYAVLADRSGYQVNVKTIRVVPDKKKPTHHNFRININYITNKGKEKRTVVTGRAKIRLEDKKIDSLIIEDNGGILQEMSEEGAHY